MADLAGILQVGRRDTGDLPTAYPSLLSNPYRRILHTVQA